MASAVQGRGDSNPVVADGEPLPPGIVALLDEASAVAGGGVQYLLASVVLLDVADAPERLASEVADRVRPFHWIREGPVMRQAVLQDAADLGALAIVRSRSCARSNQVATRRALLWDLAVRLAADGIDTS